MAFLIDRDAFTGTLPDTAVFHLLVNTGTVDTPNWVDYKSPWSTIIGNVLSFGNRAGFPATGDPKLLYIATDKEKTYRWDSTGGTYVALDEDPDQVIFTTKSAFPVTGVVDTLYIAKDENKAYYWDGVKYQVISATAEALTFSIANSSGGDAPALSVWKTDGTLANPTDDLVDVIGVSPSAINLGVTGSITAHGKISGVASAYLVAGQTIYLASGGVLSNTKSDIIIGTKQANGDILVNIRVNPEIVETLRTDVDRIDNVTISDSVAQDATTGVLTLKAVNNLNVNSGIYTLPALSEDDVFAISVPSEHAVKATITSSDGKTFVDGKGNTPDTTLLVDVSVANNNLNNIYTFKVVGNEIRGA